jgi:hypothetical protein
VPDEAPLRVSGDHALHDLVDAIELLVAGDDLDAPLLLVGGVRGEVLQQVQHDVWAEHRGHRAVEVLQRGGRRFLIVEAPRSPQLDAH